MSYKYQAEIVQTFDGLYYINLYITAESHTGKAYTRFADELSEYVDYQTLWNEVKDKIGIKLPKERELNFEQIGNKSYAYLNGEQDLCCLTLDKALDNEKVNWQDGMNREESAVEAMKLLFGCISADITLEEAREERLNKI